MILAESLHVAERVFSAAERQKAAKSGAAMPDGSFPIHTPEDLANARQAIGRAAPDKQDAVKAHIRKRAKALGVSEAGTNPEPFSTSKTSNWVARKGGLPTYIQHVAHDIMNERGFPESQAIAIAISQAKKNAAKGNAQAAAAVAEWEKMKASEGVLSLSAGR